MDTQLDWFEQSRLERLAEIESEPNPNPNPNPAPAPIREIYVDALGIEWEYPTYPPMRPIFNAMMMGKVATMQGEKFVGWVWDVYKNRYVADTVPCKRLAYKNGANYTVVEMWAGGMKQWNHSPNDVRGVFYWLCKWQVQFVGLE